MTEKAIHMHSQSFLEEHLSDGREWLFDTVSPSFADFSIYAIYGWVTTFRAMREVLTPIKFPRSHSVSPVLKVK